MGAHRYGISEDFRTLSPKSCPKAGKIISGHSPKMSEDCSRFSKISEEHI